MTTANDPILAQGSCYQQGMQGSSSTLPEGPHLEALLSSQLVGLKVHGLVFHGPFKYSLFLQLLIFLVCCESIFHVLSQGTWPWLSRFCFQALTPITTGSQVLFSVRASFTPHLKVHSLLAPTLSSHWLIPPAFQSWTIGYRYVNSYQLFCVWWAILEPSIGIVKWPVWQCRHDAVFLVFLSYVVCWFRLFINMMEITLYL